MANISNVLGQLRSYINNTFDLTTDKEDDLKTINDIEKGVEFRGANLWVLIFAILIASIGLNMNSTAVVIGAMLISPLMGPIMGIGMGAGINDFELIKKSLKNLATAVTISILTSAIYFLITPLSDASTELLSRTKPTIWDVLIALVGGLAGIVAGSRKEKSNAIPGVAIATALMPPLCTAGYALATRNWLFFGGALYLFFINSVFISLSTLFVVRFLKYPKKEFLDAVREKKVRRYIAIFVLLFIIPSIWLAVRVVKDSVMERNAELFVRNEFQFDGTPVYGSKLHLDKEPKRLVVFLSGDHISTDVIALTKKHMSNYDLEGIELKIIQNNGSSKEEFESFKKEWSEKFSLDYLENQNKKNKDVIDTKTKTIKELEDELFKFKLQDHMTKGIAIDLKYNMPHVKEFSLSTTVIENIRESSSDTVTMALIHFDKRPSSKEKQSISNWLKEKTQADSLKLVVY